MKHVSLGIVALFAIGIVLGCSSEKPLSEEEGIASALKGVDPDGPDGGPPKGAKGATKVDPSKLGG